MCGKYFSVLEIASPLGWGGGRGCGGRRERGETGRADYSPTSASWSLGLHARAAELCRLEGERREVSLRVEHRQVAWTKRVGPDKSRDLWGRGAAACTSPASRAEKRGGAEKRRKRRKRPPLSRHRPLQRRLQRMIGPLAMATLMYCDISG